MYKTQVDIIISERRRETRREAWPRSTQRASCYSHMGKQKNIITREIFILAMWFIEKKIFLFDVEPISVMNQPGSNRPDPARPGPARP